MSEHMPPSESGSPSGMSVRQARGIEFSIVGLCVIALLMIFQPFSLTLFGIGAAAIDWTNYLSHRVVSTFAPFAIALFLGVLFYSIAAFGPAEALAKLG